jgi:hippurate hydrolase
VLGGSFRLGDPDTRERMGELIEDIARNTAAAYGVDADVSIRPRYGATVNHAREAAEYRRALIAELGEDALEGGPKTPIMASEDFSYYLESVPGAFALIGADDGQGHHHPCHSAKYDFNDRLIDVVGRLYARIAGAPVEEK